MVGVGVGSSGEGLTVIVWVVGSLGSIPVSWAVAEASTVWVWP